MRERPLILLDVDGPLTQGFVELACQLIREESNGAIDAHAKDIDQWDLMTALKVPKDVEERVYQRLEGPGIAFDFAPNEGAVDFVADLNTWATVYVVTSPLGGRHWQHDRERWLLEWFKIPSRRVFSVKDKFMVIGDALVDDKLTNLQEWKAEHGDAAMAILWRCPHNRHDTWTGPEAFTYAELAQLLEPLKRDKR